jgi:NADH-quinone oxidoreductase subunit L
MLVTGLVLLGVWLAYVLFLRRLGLLERWLALPGVAVLQRLSFGGLGFDRFYDRVLVRPFLWLVRVNRDDVVDAAWNLLAAGTRLGYRGLSLTQTGGLRWYAAGVVFGAVLVLGVALWG